MAAPLVVMAITAGERYPSMLPACQVGQSSSYLDGRWVPRGRPPPYAPARYRKNTDGFPCAACGCPVPVAPAAQGQRRDPSTNRSLYDWQPRSCALPQFSDHASAECAALDGAQILFVGDSTMAYQFISFVLLLNGTMGKQMIKANAMISVTASACNDRVRLLFRRNDLSLWSHNSHDLAAFPLSAPRCVQFAGVVQRDADLVVIGVGQHFQMTAALYPYVDPTGPRAGARSDANAAGNARTADSALTADNALSIFARHVLNETFSRVVAALQARGRPASSLVVLGSSIAMPGCSTANAPSSLADATRAMSGQRLQHEFQKSWDQLPLLNSIGSALARGLGAVFVDVAEQSLQRADATLARNVPRPPWMAAGTFREDCVHYCLPGPYDAWSAQLASALGGAWADAWTSGRPPAGTRHFFQRPLSVWLAKQPKFRQSLPPCRDGEMPEPAAASCDPDALSIRWWWLKGERPKRARAK
jgi:hypothetical protein